MSGNPIFYVLRRGWQYAGSKRPIIVLYLLMFVVAQLICLAEPYVIGKLLNTVQTSTTSSTMTTQDLVKTVYTYLLIYLGIKVTFWMLHGPARVIQRAVGFHIKANYKAELFRIVTMLPLSWQRDNHSGESINKINRATQQLGDFFDFDLYELSRLLLQLIGTEVILFWVQPFAGFAAAGTTVVALIFIYSFDKFLFEQYKRLNQCDNSIASAVQDYLTNIISVISLRLEAPVLTEIRRRISLSYPSFKTSISVSEFKWFCTSMLVTIMIVSVLAWYTGTTLSAGHMILGGTFFILFDYLSRIGNSFFSLTGLYGQIVRRAADLRGAESLHEAVVEFAVPTETEAELLAQRASAGCLESGSPSSYNPAGEAQDENISLISVIPHDWKKIEVRNLRFTYKDDQNHKHHLKGVNIDLVRGKSIALVGESGSGKSTLLNLLRGLQNPASVFVHCDGQSLITGLSPLKSRTTLIPQSPEIFADTIRFNLTFGLPTDEEAIMEAIRMARFEHVLNRLPAGLETDIAQNGVNLSGGERQRLALARGIIFSRNSDIILLDEPTSSIDTLNEHGIYKNLLKLYKGSSIVSSIHKLHLLDLFDEIYVMNKGKIIERGQLADLLRNKGPLAEMWNNQQRAKSLDEAAKPVRATARA
jgi:ATP-binding cassette, subfamily B, bacterial